ncbi:hypothetical protein [Mesorhizobium atlanticum]|uniref:Uncharacterized protein n=1 Tax=Mesorhizobium atlanticum TaxID=2233532 RepID=A0A330GQ98_9HYPH|nr:hypothetical protein [Mesorhizobium atlanticum]RAZ75813.1 hypothetical protein DPM35_13770 [Mesorhizobium atlanticum]
MSLLASADFNDRLVPRSAPALSQEPDRATSCPFTAGQDQTAPLATEPCDGAVALSEASRFILSLIAAYRGRGEVEALAWAIAEGGNAIGVPALLARGADDIEDLADVPGYARWAANRFRSGGP